MNLHRLAPIVFLLPLAACVPTNCRPSTVGPAPTSSGLPWAGIGDSVLYGDGPRLQSQTGANGRLDAEIGRGPTSSLIGNPGSLAVARKLIPTVKRNGWAILQEDGGSETAESYRAFVDAIVELTPDDRCIAWVTPFNVWDRADTDAFVDEIHAGLDAQPCHAVVPWHEVADADEEGMMTDGLHPTDAGHDWLVDAIADVVS